MTALRLMELAGSFWRRECERFGVDPLDPKLVSSLAVGIPAAEPADLAALPRGLTGLHALGELHLASLERATRSKHGRFYTPPELAAVLAARAVSDMPLMDGLIVDPACGGGSLLAAVVDRFVRAMSPEVAVAEVASRIRGTDLDGRAVQLCDLAIRVALLPAWSQLSEKERPALPRFARVANGLDDRAPAAVVVANPPFGRCRLSAAERKAWTDVLYGHAHWPSLFLHAAVERLVPNGSAVFVLPASLVGGAYYQRLRTYLNVNAPPDWFAFVDDRDGVFTGGVLQETLLLRLVRGRMVADCEVERIRGDGELLNRHSFSARSWRRHQSWVIPRTAEDAALVDDVATDSAHLSDYGWSVSTGPLVWNRHRSQLADDPGQGRLPVIWAGDIRGGRVELEPGRSRRFVTPAPGQDWLVLDRPAVLVQRTTAPEQARRLVAGLLDEAALAELGGRVVVENHVNVCTWNGHGPLRPDSLVEYLTSERADRLYRCMTGSVAVSAFELRQLPLPSRPESVVSGADSEIRAA